MGDSGLVEALSGSDPLSANLTPEDRALLEFAIRLTEAPSAVSQTDVDALKRAGFDDRAVHDACQVVAYFAYVNRVAEGLGVELES